MNIFTEAIENLAHVTLCFLLVSLPDSLFWILLTIAAFTRPAFGLFLPVVGSRAQPVHQDFVGLQLLVLFLNYFA